MKEGAEEPLLFLYLIDENVGGHSRGLSVATIIVLPAVSKRMSLPMLGELLGPPPSTQYTNGYGLSLFIECRLFGDKRSKKSIQAVLST